MTKLKHTTLLLIGLLLNSLTTSAMAGTGYLGITSVPTGAQIYINNKLVGKTPYEDYNIKEGQYTIKATYKDNTGSIYPAQSKQITINELDPRTEKFTFDIRGKSKGSFGGSYDSQAVKEYLQIGNVLVLSKPTGARVFINGDELKATPFSRKGVSIGRYNIEFKLNGQSLKGNFDIVKDKTVKLIADFGKGKIIDTYRQAQVQAQAKREQAKQAKGTLVVKSNPEGVKVYVDNKYVGITPYQDYSITIGKHSVGLILSKDFPTTSREIFVNKTDPVIVEFDFSPDVSKLNIR